MDPRLRGAPTTSRTRPAQVNLLAQRRQSVDTLESRSEALCHGRCPGCAFPFRAAFRLAQIGDESNRVRPVGPARWASTGRSCREGSASPAIPWHILVTPTTRCPAAVPPVPGSFSDDSSSSNSSVLCTRGRADRAAVRSGAVFSLGRRSRTQASINLSGSVSHRVPGQFQRLRATRVAISAAFENRGMSFHSDPRIAFRAGPSASIGALG